MNSNLQSSSRDDLADRMLDLALAEKAGGKLPPDLAEKILARAAQPVSLPESRRSDRVAPAYGSFVPVGVSLCLLTIAALTAVLWQPDLTIRTALSSRDGDLLRAYEKDLFEVQQARYDIIQRQNKLAEVVEEFNILVEQQRYAEAEVLAKEARAIDPESAVAQTMIEKSRFMRRIEAQVAVRDQKERGFYGAMEAVDGTSAPMNDRAPIAKTNPTGEIRAKVDSTTPRAYPLASLDSPPIRHGSEKQLRELESGRQKHLSTDYGVVQYSVNGKSYSRVAPYTVTKSVPAASRDLKPLKGDDLFERRDQLLVDVSRYKKQLDTHGKVEDADGTNIMPKVNAEITAISDAKKLVEISVGSDDGIRLSHEMDVFRNATYLGKLRVVRTSPDKAVAELVADSLRGPIVKGDKVGSTLFARNEPDPVPEAEPVPPVEPDPAGDKFDVLPDNDFAKAKEEPLSTFSIDVDTASYSKMRQFLMQAGQLPPGEAVRLEELVNYFPYDYAPPTDDKPFAAHVETAACPWNAGHRLVRIGLKGRVIDDAKRPPCNLVFLVDVSGSMDEPNKLPLVTHGLKMLAGELTERDTVAMVVYAGAAGMVLPPTRGDARPTIYTALSQLKAGGSTNGGEGIELAYKTCQENFIEGGVNRVILCTDGDFNVGLTSTGQLVDLAKEKAQQGVFLSVLGFGMGNHNDEMLEAVSNKANGNHAFIDSLNEARKVLVRQIGGTLVTIAKDVKIQVEFDPTAVVSYRLLGYENRLLAAEDFADDKKDAGEIGAGHTVTALYEIVPAPEARSDGEEKSPTRRVSEDTQARSASERGNDKPSENILTLKLRYKQPDGDKSALLEFPVKDSGRRFAEATPDFQFASAVASFGMILRKSKHLGDSNFAAVAEIAAAAKGADPHGYRAEFVELVKKAQELKKAE